MAKVNIANSKFIILIRHGELNNPRNIVYNRDNVMRAEDNMHLSPRGIEQMKNLGRLIEEKGFKVQNIYISPEIRCQESIRYLIEGHHFSKWGIEQDLDDNYAPGPYLLGMTMDQLKEIGGNVYEGPMAKRYHHESPEQIVKRMRKAFDRAVLRLDIGETAILVSHGDPLAWLFNDIIIGYIPVPSVLRDSFYPEKGVGTVIVLGPRNKLHHFELNPQDAGSKY